MRSFSTYMFVLGVCTVCWGEPTWHHLEIWNFSDEKMEINVKGVQLYALGRGPQEFGRGGAFHPNRSASWTTMGYLSFTYPLEVTWKSQESEKGSRKEFYAIPGIVGNTNKITMGGTLAVHITTNFEAEVLFVKDYRRRGVSDQTVINYQFEQLRQIIQRGGDEQQYTDSLSDVSFGPTFWERMKEHFSQTDWMDQCPLVSVYNQTDIELRIDVTGLKIYPIGIGPQELNKTVSPKNRAGYSYLKTISIDYPIRVSWLSADGTQKGVQEFNTVPGLSGTELSGESVLALRITPEFEAQIVYVPPSEFKGPKRNFITVPIEPYFESGAKNKAGSGSSE